MIVIEPFKGKPVTEQRVEIVERKGTGHPDYLCDSMMEAVSIALSREYMNTFGVILHHNIDKGLLAAGRVEKLFGGGSVLATVQPNKVARTACSGNLKDTEDFPSALYCGERIYFCHRPACGCSSNTLTPLWQVRSSTPRRMLKNF